DTGRSPYQDTSTTSPSAASSSSDRARPASVALACTTRSRSPVASSGVANATPSASATAARAGAASTSSTSAPGMPASRAARLPRRHHVAAERGAGGGLVVGDRRRGRRGPHDGGLVRVEAEHRPADEFGWSVFDHADGEVPVLHRGGELALLEGSAHHRVLAS